MAIRFPGKMVALAMLSTLLWGQQAHGAPARTEALRADLSLERSALSTSDPVRFQVSLTNTGADDLWVYKWRTPFFGIEDDLFVIQRNGESVAYVGKHVKRGAPTPSDYFLLAPGESRSAEIDLSQHYDLGRPGTYAVKFLADGVDLVREDRRKGVTAYEISGEIASEWVDLAMSGPDRGASFLEPRQLDESAPVLGTRALTPTFVSCSNTRQTALLSALTQAETYSVNAHNYLTSLTPAQQTASTRYRTWFGTHTSARYNTVTSNFNAIKSAFQTQRVTFLCDCTSSAYAFVYSNRPYEIHLCNAFWNAPTAGTDSKGGTLVHEMSHFSVVAGTSDYAYGQTACKNLANTNPSRATRNADSHEYFAENNPSLP